MRSNFFNKFRINKKGMGVGQVFVFIIAAITFALIMIFGYKSIAGFLKSGENVEFVQFKTDLETSIKKIHTEYDSVRIEQFKASTKFNQICFIDLDYSPTEEEVAGLCKKNGFACTVWEESTGYDTADENVFLTPPSPVQIKVHKIKMENGNLCLDINRGNFELVLIGKGDHTELMVRE